MEELDNAGYAGNGQLTSSRNTRTENASRALFRAYCRNPEMAALLSDNLPYISVDSIEDAVRCVMEGDMRGLMTVMSKDCEYRRQSVGSEMDKNKDEDAVPEQAVFPK